MPGKKPHSQGWERVVVREVVNQALSELYMQPCFETIFFD